MLGDSVAEVDIVEVVVTDIVADLDNPVVSEDEGEGEGELMTEPDMDPVAVSERDTGLALGDRFLASCQMQSELSLTASTPPSYVT